MPQETLAQRVRLLRQSQGWTQVQLAERLGMSSPQITRLESDKQDEGRIQLATLRRLADAFEITVGELLGESL